MNNKKDAMYCRLCAELKQHKNLINLQTDEETCQKVVNRLSRFNIIMDFQENILPKTVCLLCVKSLERAFVFVTAVEEAQAFLSDFILVQINTVASYSCDENMLSEPPDTKSGIIDIKDEHSQDSMEVKDVGTNLSEKCDSGEVMIEVKNDFDYSVIIGNTEEHIIENKHDIQPSNEIIEENTDFKVETLDLYHDEDNKNILKDIFEKELDSEPILLDNTVCVGNINKQNDSNEAAKNMDKSIPQLQPQECNSEQIPPKQLATTLDSKTNINKIRNPKKNKQKDSNISTKNTDADVEHIKMTWKDYEWKCYYCETLFPTIEELQKHSMQYHNSCNPYQCTDCVIRSSNLNRFMKHVRQKHKNYLLYSCYKCFKKFTKPYQGGHHKKKVHEDSDYVCSGCNTPFQSNRELKEHAKKYYKQFSRKVPFDLTCSICNKNTASAKDMHKHLLSHQTKKEYNVICETCGKCFAKKERLKAHMIIHGAVKIHSCDVCNASFTRVSELQSHKGMHSGIKPFTCDHCGKSFRRKTYIARHTKTHMDVLYPCTLCNKNFGSAPYLKNHMLQHTGEKPYSCALCQRDFTNWSNYNKHMKRRHATDMSKTKRTPSGTYPVDPVTGEAVVPAKEKISEWKKRMMVKDNYM